MVVTVVSVMVRELLKLNKPALLPGFKAAATVAAPVTVPEPLRIVDTLE
jgi:hypothetical protein